MKILITGGKGYIARNLKLFFEQEGHEIFAPSHQELEITNLLLLTKYVNSYRPDVIIHSACKGGRRNYKDTYEDFITNIIMYENIIKVSGDRIVIIYGSGAEFDRRYEINRAKEYSVYHSWPIDLYGLSKNIITKRILTEQRQKRIHILRIFACFNHDEDEGRFIKTSILNLKKGLPIIIHQNKEMDFFYINDLFAITKHIILNGNPIYDKNLNAVYYNKNTLLQIAELIKKYMNISNSQIILNNDELGLSYSGCGIKMSNKDIHLIGLEEGIRQTCNILA